MLPDINDGNNTKPYRRLYAASVVFLFLTFVGLKLSSSVSFFKNCSRLLVFLRLFGCFPHVAVFVTATLWSKLTRDVKWHPGLAKRTRDGKRQSAIKKETHTQIKQGAESFRRARSVSNTAWDQWLSCGRLPAALCVLLASTGAGSRVWRYVTHPVTNGSRPFSRRSPLRPSGLRPGRGRR